MSTATRIIATILIATFAGTSYAPENHSVAAAPRTISFSQSPVISERPQRPLMVIGGTTEDHNRLEEATGLFKTEGLHLPALIVEFSDTTDACLGNAGIYLAASRHEALSTDMIAICGRIRLDLVHELAHAWEHHNVTDDTRQAFLDRWGLESWRDRNVDWHERGIEKAANTVAFGLVVDWATDDANILRFVCGYELLTGQGIPHPESVDCATYQA